MTKKAKKLGKKRVKSSFLEGINLREYFAGLAMMGFICRNNREINSKIVPPRAIEYANALLEELSKTE